MLLLLPLLITHYDITIGMLATGKHVLLEKPICDSVQKAQELLKEAKKEDLILGKKLK